MNPVTGDQQRSLRLWGEEEHDGAIYAVYLKKVRYHPRTNTSGDDISHLEWETIRVRVVKAGTLEKLVESLATDTGELESTYINVFFSTYRSFATSQQVLSLLIDRYVQISEDKVAIDGDTKEMHLSSLAKTLMLWMDMFPEDFFEPPQFLLFHQLIEFTRKYLPGSMLELRAKHKLEKFQKCDKYTDFNIFPSVSLFENSLSCPTMLHMNFLDINEEHFAKQLTYVDAELFKKLVPYHCLGSIWSQREKLKSWSTLPSSVSATVNQFNAVSYRAISTVLSDPSLKPFMRAKIISKWIRIAQMLRFLKNFSSLKAITAALQSNAVYRLRKTWFNVPRDSIETFTELARIFSEENNQMNCRELLIKEGSAKFADTVGSNDKQLQKALQKHLSGNTASTMQGTIPYLGTFLTDLTMIDTAVPDLMPNGFINFDKKRKEFEILVQIKLLQSAANNYDICPDAQFHAWFNSIPVLDDSESYELSCLIEPPSAHPSEKRPLFPKLNSTPKRGHQKNDSISSTSTSSSGTQFYDQMNIDGINTSQNGSNLNSKLSKSCSNLSLSSLCLNQSSNDSRSQSQEFYVIKVSLEQNDSDTDGINLYKSIMLSNHDRTPTVIANALMKHGIEGDPDDYILAQLVPGGEIVFPSSANVFYAINTAYELNFILRSRQETNNCNTKKSKSHLMKRFLNS